VPELKIVNRQSSIASLNRQSQSPITNLNRQSSIKKIRNHQSAIAN